MVCDVVAAGGKVACGSCGSYGGKVSGGEIVRSGAEFGRGRTKDESKGTARELERERSKRRNIAELVGGKDSGGEMERKIEIGSVQGSAPTSSVRCFNLR